jgi:hypothetical protein
MVAAVPVPSCPGYGRDVLAPTALSPGGTMRRVATLVTVTVIGVLGGCSAAEPDAARMGCTQIGCIPGVPAADPVGTCTEADPDGAGGRYAAGHAGWVTVYLVGDVLDLDGIQAADGWSETIVTERDTELVVEFTRGEEIVDFDVDVEDGLLYAEHCRVA